MNPRTIFAIVAIVCTCALSWPSAVCGQSAGTRVISGVVLDPSGASIPGAEVILFGGDGNEISRATTDKDGNFLFERLLAGAYKIDARAPGFRKTRMDAKLGAKTLPQLRVVLPIAVQNEVVNVTGNDVSLSVSTNASENQNATTLDRSALDRVPVFDQDYVGMLSRFLDDSAIGTSGISLIVNGIEANGPGVTPSAVQEVRINQNPYSARFARPGRARLEIITKGGTPAYHGSVNFLFRDAVFDARNAFAAGEPPEQRQFYEGSLTGPIGQDKKTSFLLSLEWDKDDNQAAVVATDLSGPVNENVPQPMRHFFYSGRVFHDFSENDHFWIGYSFEHQSNKNLNIGGNVLPEAGTNTTFLEHEVNVSYRHIFSPRWVNQLQFLVGHYDAPTFSLNENPQIVVYGFFTGGGAQADARRTEYHFDGTEFLTYVSGKHQLVFGVDIPDISRRGMDDFTNKAGTYTFASLSDFQHKKPATYLVQQGQGHVVFLERVVSGFIEDNIRLKPTLSVSLGMRYYWQNYFHDEPHNFAPRFGFAWAPMKNSKTIFRGGAGVFYDRSGPRPIADLLHYNGVNLLRFILSNPQNPPFPVTFPVTPAELIGAPTSEVVLDPHSRIPYTVQYSLGIERQVTAKSTFSATYVGSRGIDLFRSRDINAPLPPYPNISRPNANLGQERQIESEGYQKSNTMELTFRGNPSRFFSGQVQYTLSKTYNDSSGITYFPGNSYFPSADWARSDNDRRHKFNLLGSTQVTKLFSIGAALSLYSGKPVNVTTGADNNGDGIFNDRPPNYARNSLHGPGLINLDLNIERDFPLVKEKKEGPMLTVGWNSFNVLNHRNDVTYVGVLSSIYFGRAVSALPPRRMQLNLQFKF